MLAALRNSTHILTHILFGILAWVVVNFGHPIDPLLLIVVAAGALLPDVDVSTSFVGRSVRPLSKWLEARFGHRQEVHSILAVLVVAGLAWPLRFIPGVGVEMWLALLVGWCSHLILDLLNPAGIAFLLPLSNARVHLLGGKVRQNEPSEKILLVVLVLAVAGALWVSGVGTSQLLHAVLPVPDLARESYRDWEGRYRVYADIDGTWQDGTHRRVEGRHEVLGLRGQDFTLRDPESGAEFVAGQSVNAEVYLNRIHVTQGEAIPPASGSPPATPTPTPQTLTIRIAHVTDPQSQIKVRPGDVVIKGQLLADLSAEVQAGPLAGTALPAPLPTATPTPLPTPTWEINPLALAQAEAKLALARAEYRRAIAPPTPNADAVLYAQVQLELATAQLLAAGAELVDWAASESPPPDWMIAQREQEANAYATLVEHWSARLVELQNPRVDPLAVAVAEARLRVDEVAYQRALASPTPRPTKAPPTPPPGATLTPTPTPVVIEYRAIVPGRVLDVRIVSIRGNEATVDIVLVVSDDVMAGSLPPPALPVRQPATVVRVVEGDAIDVLLNDSEEQVRLIGVDTPQSKHPQKGVECYGPQASDYVARLLPAGTGVTLVTDVEQRDQDGRLLAYVYLVQGEMVNAMLVREGYARTLVLPPNTAHAAEFADLEREAQAAGRGWWGECPHSSLPLVDPR